jgi:glycosyltransferase involved in cell wall biosynthesis
VTGARGRAERVFLELAKSRGVADRVELTGQLAADDLVALYSGAAAFAFPSAWEGFGLPLLEAMSVGLPCVVTDGGALPEVSAGAATVVPVGSAGALADALQELLGDERRAEEASRRSTARAASFTVSRFAAAHLEVYERL